MPQIKSAKKRVRQAAVRTQRNQHIRSRTKNAVRGLRQLVDEGKVQEAQDKLPEVLRIIDVAWSKGVWHKNRAARTKARLTHSVHKSTTK